MEAGFMVVVLEGAEDEVVPFFLPSGPEELDRLLDNFIPD